MCVLLLQYLGPTESHVPLNRLENVNIVDVQVYYKEKNIEV